MQRVFKKPHENPIPLYTKSHGFRLGSPQSRSGGGHSPEPRWVLATGTAGRNRGEIGGVNRARSGARGNEVMIQPGG